MVVLDVDHPEIRDFIQWKAREEKKVAALIAAGYPSDFNGDAYRTVSGQNANNSVRVTDKFIEAVRKDEVWQTTARTTGDVVERLSARQLWRDMAEAAWKCADPGLQFDDTVNKWHTCKATDRIYASNPCSEFMFLDDTACNLASLNLLKFLDEKTGEFDVEGRKALHQFCQLSNGVIRLAAQEARRQHGDVRRQMGMLGIEFVAQLLNEPSGTIAQVSDERILHRIGLLRHCA